LNFSGAAAVCMDLGHLTLKRGVNPVEDPSAPKV